MGLENRIVYNLVDVIEGSCRMKQALIRDKRFPDLVSASVRTDERQDVRITGTDAETGFRTSIGL